jgi:DNA-binding response OmpR family regulator
MEGRASILVVDDQPEILENLALVLELEGYEVLTARDGVEALALLESRLVDLILADIAMPRLNGYQLFKRLREDPRLVAVPFVFLTARAMDSDVRYGKELGVDDYLTKPIQPEDLLAAVHGRLVRAQQLAQASQQLAPASPSGLAVLDLGPLRVDLNQHRVWMEGVEVQLSAREFVLLAYLSQRVDRAVPAQELIRVTHELDTDFIEAGSLLRPLVRTLRRKLGYPVGDMGCIENVRGVGYRLTAPQGR